MRTRFGLLAVIALLVVLAALSATAATVLPVSTTWSTFNWIHAPDVWANPSFGLTIVDPTTVQVTDGRRTGDQFEVYVDGLLRLTTSSVTPNIQTGLVWDDAWADARLSKGWFDLGAGDYLITVKIIAIATDPTVDTTWGDGYIRAIPSTQPQPDVPEPMSMMLGAMGLAAMGGLRKLRVR